MRLTSLRKAIEEIEDPVLREKAQKQLERGDPRKQFRGFFSRADDRGRVGIAPWRQSTALGPAGESRIVARAYNVRLREPLLVPRPVVRRSDRERVESLARRFWDTVRDDPRMAPLVLREIQAEYWKAGSTVSYEDCKRAAIALLKKAAAEAAKRERTAKRERRV